MKKKFQISIVIGLLSILLSQNFSFAAGYSDPVSVITKQQEVYKLIQYKWVLQSANIIERANIRYYIPNSGSFGYTRQEERYTDNAGIYRYVTIYYYYTDVATGKNLN